MISAARYHYGRPYSLLWTARVVSFLGDTLAQVTLVLLAARQAHPALAVSLLLLAQTLPRLLGPIAGLVSDRAELRVLMVGCDVGQAMLVGAIALLAPPFGVTLALVAAMTCLATFFLPASQSALPALVAMDDLGDANALLRVGFNLSHAAGPPLAGLLIAVASSSSVLLFDALTFLCSAALLIRLPALKGSAPASPERAGGVLLSARIGLAFIRRHATARTVTLGLFIVTLFLALDNVGLVFLAERSFGAGSAGYGLLLAGYGVGMIAGPLIVLRLGGGRDSSRILVAGCAVMGVGTMLCGLSPALWIAMACQVTVGVGNGWQNVANDTLIQQTVPYELLGRVFGVVYSAPYAALLITYAAGGLLLSLTSPRAVFVIAGAGTLGAALLIRLLLGDERRAEPPASGGVPGPGPRQFHVKHRASV